MLTRIAVLASGRGSNLEAVIRHLAAHGEGAGVVLVASDRANAGALGVARAHDIASAALEMGPGHATALRALLDDHGAQLVVLAGYLRLVPAEVVRPWRGRVVNVHPALLPAFGGAGMYGARVHRAVLAAGARLSGVTVHFVDEVYDRGATITQWPVPVHPGDTADTLAARVLRVEHLLYPRAILAVARGDVRLAEDGRAEWTPRATTATAAFLLRDTTDDDLARSIDAALGC